MSDRRTFHLGVDYGTSASKLVLRDFGAPGGERAQLLTRGGSLRFASAVAIGDEFVILGVPPSAWDRDTASRGSPAVYESVKMRLAHEVSPEKVALRVTESEPPKDLGWRGLAALSVWWLISEGYRTARGISGGDEFAFGMTLGIPMSFYRVGALREEFLTVGRAAWHLLRRHGVLARPVLSTATAQKKLQEAFDAVLSRPLGPGATQEWLRSEAEAAVWWSFQSPAVGDGPYGKADVGAGTTNASLFRITSEHLDGHWVKTGLAFFGASATDYGMDAVDRAMAAALGEDDTEWFLLRGKEDRLLQSPRLCAVAGEALAGIEYAVKRSWGEARQRFGARHELDAWRDRCRLFLIGGGSQVRAVRARCCSFPWDTDVRLGEAAISCPPDLWVGERRVVEAELPFVLVAYGLSDIRPSVPVAETPDDIPPLPDLTEYRKRVHHEEIYGNG